MVSYTQANRAKRVLQQHGISSAIYRLEHLGPEGCGFVLNANADCGRVSALLSREGIPFRSPQEGRDVRWQSILIMQRPRIPSRRRFAVRWQMQWYAMETPDAAGM